MGKGEDMVTTPGPQHWLSTADKPDDLQALRQIALKAFEVRVLQVEYFKARSMDVLTASKQAERDLDKMLTAPAQGGLGI